MRKRSLRLDGFTHGWKGGGSRKANLFQGDFLVRFLGRVFCSKKTQGTKMTIEKFNPWMDQDVWILFEKVDGPMAFFFSVLEMKITNMTPKKKCDSLLRVQKMSGKNINSYVCQHVFKMLIGLKLTFQRVSSASMSKVKDVHVISGSFLYAWMFVDQSSVFFFGWLETYRPSRCHWFEMKVFSVEIPPNKYMSNCIYLQWWRQDVGSSRVCGNVGFACKTRSKRDGGTPKTWFKTV